MNDLWAWISEPSKFTNGNMIELMILWLWFCLRGKKCGCKRCRA